MVETHEDVLPRSEFKVQLVSDVCQVRCHVSLINKQLRKNVSDSDNNVNVRLVKLEKT